MVAGKIVNGLYHLDVTERFPVPTESQTLEGLSIGSHKEWENITNGCQRGTKVVYNSNRFTCNILKTQLASCIQNEEKEPVYLNSKPRKCA